MSVKANLVLQSFGKESEYKRAILTVLSFYSYSSLPLNQTAVYLFTDSPEYFNSYLLGLPVNFVALTPEKIQRMRGDIDFLHRIKISVIEEAFGLIDGNMLYADSDTFFIADPTFLLKHLAPDHCYMHLWEYEFESLRNMPLPAGETFQAFLELIESREFPLANGSTFRVSPQHSSWNAGVMFFHPSHKKFIPDVYSLTDQFYLGSKNHASEQYAFSIMMQENATIEPCNQVIYHYWYRVKKQIIDQTLEQQLTEDWGKKSMKEKLAEVLSWTKMLPKVFLTHELTIQDNAIQAFNENQFLIGSKWAIKALKQKPFDKRFLKHTLYHLRRYLQK